MTVVLREDRLAVRRRDARLDVDGAEAQLGAGLGVEDDVDVVLVDVRHIELIVGHKEVEEITSLNVL